METAPRDGIRSALATGERGGNYLNGVEDYRTENGSSQGQNLALTGLGVPTSLDIGTASVGLTDPPRISSPGF